MDDNLWGPLTSQVISQRDIESFRKFFEYFRFQVRPELNAVMCEFENWFNLPENQRPEFPIKLQEVFRAEVAYAMTAVMHPVWNPENTHEIKKRYARHGSDYVMGILCDDMLAGRGEFKDLRNTVTQTSQESE